jgi:hypothetical protein
MCNESLRQHGAGHFVCHLSLEMFVLFKWCHSELDFGTLFPAHRAAVTPGVFHASFKCKIFFGFALEVPQNVQLCSGGLFKGHNIDATS